MNKILYNDIVTYLLCQVLFLKGKDLGIGIYLF